MSYDERTSWPLEFFWFTPDAAGHSDGPVEWAVWQQRPSHQSHPAALHPPTYSETSEEHILTFIYFSHYPLTAGVARAPVPHLDLGFYAVRCLNPFCGRDSRLLCISGSLHHYLLLNHLWSELFLSKDSWRLLSYTALHSWRCSWDLHRSNFIFKSLCELFNHPWF